MTDHQTLDALVSDMTLRVRDLAECVKESKRLSDSGNPIPAHESSMAASATSASILRLSNRIQTVAERTGRQAFGQSVDSLLQQLPGNPAEWTSEELQAWEKELGLPVGSPLSTFRAKAHADLEQNGQPEDIWQIAFMVGLATVAAAAVGAPLAALATNQAIGPKVLEEAIITFTSTGILAIAAGIKKRDKPDFPESELESEPVRSDKFDDTGDYVSRDTDEEDVLDRLGLHAVSDAGVKARDLEEIDPYSGRAYDNDVSPSGGASYEQTLSPEEQDPPERGGFSIGR